jgi:hypothetical protein
VEATMTIKRYNSFDEIINDVKAGKAVYYMDYNHQALELNNGGVHNVSLYSTVSERWLGNITGWQLKSFYSYVNDEQSTTDVVSNKGDEKMKQEQTPTKHELTESVPNHERDDVVTRMDVDLCYNIRGCCTLDDLKSQIEERLYLCGGLDCKFYDYDGWPIEPRSYSVNYDMDGDARYLCINFHRLDPTSKAHFNQCLKELYEHFENCSVESEDLTVQVQTPGAKSYEPRRLGWFVYWENDAEKQQDDEDRIEPRNTARIFLSRE